MAIKSFSTFINEQRGWGPKPYLYKIYEPNLSEFAHESDLIKALFEVETELEKIASNYWWNRESRQWNEDHFAIDAKIHVFPDLEKVKKILDYPELTEDELYDKYWKWFIDVREMFQEDLVETYDWIEKINWGGKSGGWLLINPDVTYDSITDDLREKFDWYIETRDDLKEWDPEAYENTKIQLNSPSWKDLDELGLTELPEGFEELGQAINIIKSTCESNISKLHNMERDLGQIQDQIDKFAQTAESDFYEYLEELPF